METEAIQEIAQMAVSAQAVDYFRIEGDGGRRVFLKNADGTYSADYLEPDRDCKFDTPDALVEWIGGELERENGYGANIYLQKESIYAEVLLAEKHKEADPPHYASCKLPFAAFYNLIKQGQTEELVYDQEQLYKFLRTKVPGMYEPADLLTKIRAVSWQSGEKAISTVGKGERNVGRDLEAKLQNIDVLPDTITFDVPIYELYNNYKIRANFDADPVTKKFTISFLPGAVAAAYDQAAKEIEGLLLKCIAQRFPETEDGPEFIVRVFRGSL